MYICMCMCMYTQHALVRKEQKAPFCFVFLVIKLSQEMNLPNLIDICSCTSLTLLFLVNSNPRLENSRLTSPLSLRSAMPPVSKIIIGPQPHVVLTSVSSTGWVQDRSKFDLHEALKLPIIFGNPFVL